MVKQSSNRPLPTPIHYNHSSTPWGPILSAGAILIVGGGLLYALPEQATGESPAAPVQAVADSAPDDSLCSRQTWPYVDQRCAQRVNAARDTRQVRIVTDKGTSVTAVTPLPIVEPKAKPAPPKPAVAQNDRPIGPPAAPAVDSAPQAETVATSAPPPAPAPRSPAPQVSFAPAADNAMAQDNPTFAIREAPVTPRAASSAPVADGVDAFDGPPQKKSKAERDAEKREKREAKRRQKMNEENAREPDEVAAAVRAATAGRRAYNAVPDEVLAEVERATGAERGGRAVTVNRPGGRRIYIVPHDVATGGW